MSAKVIPNLTFLKVADLPTPASAYEGMFRRTDDGLYYSDGISWGRVDAPGVFTPIEQATYDALDTEVKEDPTILYAIVADASLLRPTRTWLEVTSAPGTPDPDTLYVENP